MTVASSMVMVSSGAGFAGGRSTSSMTWMTPLLHMISALTTFAVFTMTVASSMVLVSSGPATVVAFMPLLRSLLSTFPETTWYVRMPASSGIARSASAVRPSFSRAAVKALSVGAKTVKGPALFIVVTSSACVSAAAKVVKLPAALAVSTMSLRGAGTTTPSGHALGPAMAPWKVEYAVLLHANSFWRMQRPKKYPYIGFEAD